MQAPKPILEAIALKKCIEATYNRVTLSIAPHILYTRHGDLFVDGVALERDGRPAKEIKLGTFKLAGLEVRRVLGRTFDAWSAFDRNNEKYQGTTVFAIE